jgi:uncharacterized caspase-like protein
VSGKYALIIGNTEYADPGLAQLSAPGKDAEDFARVLKDQEIGAFDEVNILLNQPSSAAIEAIDEFFNQKKPDDLLVLYFSGHGVRDELGALYLAVKNTNRSKLRSTAVKSDYIREAMDQSRSKRQVLILDCCNSGAFAQGTKAATGVSIGTATAFDSGYGRVILTASDSTQFAWEGDKVIGNTDNSLFTHYLVEGLKGESDLDGDGRITVDELYDYAYEKVRLATPKQTPSKFSNKQQGEIVLRQSTRIENIKPQPLPDELIGEIEDTRPYVRVVAVQKLEKILKGKNIGLARTAREKLEQIATNDDSRTVVLSAKQILGEAGPSAWNGIPAPKPVSDLALERERLVRERAEAVRLAREHERKQLTQAKPAPATVLPTPAENVAQPRPRPQQGSAPSNSGTGVQQRKKKPLTWLLFAGGGLLCLITIAVAYLVWPNLPSSITPIDTQTKFAPVPVEASATPTYTNTLPPTFAPSPTITLSPFIPPSLTFTFTPRPPNTPPAPTDPVEFIRFYFDTVVYQKDFEKCWSLLTPDYQTIKAGGWDQFVTFWNTVKDWSLSSTMTEYNTPPRARVLITYRLYYYSGGSDLVNGSRYCLLWNDSIGTWQIDLRENCP